MKSKVIIVNSNSRWLGGREYMEPMTNIPILASILNGSFDYDIIDCNGEDMSEKQAEEKIAATNADIVLITTLSLDLHKQYSKMVEISRHALPNAITVMGGVYPTTCYEHAIEDKNLDFIFLGHAEERLNNFINALLNKEDISKFEGVCYYAEDGALILNPVTTYIGDVQTMVKPNYEKFNLLPYAEKGYHIAKEAVRELPVTTSYGCPHNCIFCATRTISGRKVAFRPIEDIIEEIAYLKEKYKMESILFLDDNILTNKARARKLFQRMIEENFCLKFRLANAAAWLLDEEIIDLMSRAGCYALTVSIESGCDRVLHDIIRKPMKKEIIPNAIRMCQEKTFFVSANIVIGFPSETWDEIRETIAFGELCNPDYLQINIATPLPKTDLYSFGKDTGAIPKDFDFFSGHTYQGFESGIIQTDEFTPRELEILRSYEWDRINFSTAEKRNRFCHYRGISAEELVAHRKRARLSVGQDDGMHNSKIYGKRLSDE